MDKFKYILKINKAEMENQLFMKHTGSQHAEANTACDVSSPQLSRLQALEDIPPFTQLHHFLQASLGQHYGDFNVSAHLLNTLAGVHCDVNHPVSFYPQDADSNDKRGYEEIIYQDSRVPTRDNWHDFFNGLIWLQYPRTKAYFNTMHNAQMERFGKRIRTPVRDRLTHFDECGLVLLTNICGLEKLIAEHNWHAVFVKYNAHWHTRIFPIIIGHALWEMLMQPFIGLTAKVKVIYMPDSTQNELAVLSGELGQRNSGLDNIIHDALDKQKDLEKKRPWLPMPLLGIPHWSVFKQDSAFYKNNAYFMPKTAPKTAPKITLKHRER